MKEIILCKYGEIVLKGANRASFEQLLVKDLRYRAAQCGAVRQIYRQTLAEPYLHHTGGR